jgi:rubredoxin
MSDDANLTDFAGRGDGAAEADDDGASDPEDGALGPDDGANPDDATDAEPETPTFTYTSTPDGAECAACGTTVEKRWYAGEDGTAETPDLDPDALVCPDCKVW